MQAAFILGNNTQEIELFLEKPKITTEALNLPKVSEIDIASV